VNQVSVGSRPDQKSFEPDRENGGVEISVVSETTELHFQQMDEVEIHASAVDPFIGDMQYRLTESPGAFRLPELEHATGEQ
jgi:hypothetical protein